MKAGKSFFWPLIAAIAISGGSYLGTLELQHNTVRADTTAQTAKPTPEPKTETVAPANDLSRAFRTVHNALKDAVVNIHVTKKSVAMNGQRRLQGFRLPEGFHLPEGFEIPEMPEAPEAIEGTGSGVIVSPDGYILTNNHVVEDATEITVRLDDERELKAKVVGTDPKTDLAVVKITADHLTYAKFGDSDATEVGDWVLAFGSPLGFEQTMTQGIISAKGRQIGIIGGHNPALRGLTYENFLQTDAAINPGNSGGPLVNLKGEVIGINAAIASRSGQYNGIGFSIPSNDAKYIMESLIKHGKVIRGFLDVQIEDINHPAPTDQALVDSIKKQGFNGKGALVQKVDPEGPAGKGGVQSGDVITAIDGKPVDTVDTLRIRIARTAPGTKVTLSVFRDGKTTDLSFPVGKQPDRNPAFARGDEGTENPAVLDNKDLGISVTSLDKETAKKYHLDAGQGVIVTEVAPNSLAAGLGISEGDVITRVGKTPVDTPEQFTDAMGKMKLSEGVRMSIRSQDGMDRTVMVLKK
jgi:serine protease Do